MTARRVLFICAEPVGKRPLGVAIRTLELARVTARHAEVAIAGVEPSEATAGIRVASYRRWGSPRRGPLGELVAWADTVVAQPPWPPIAALLRRSGARLIYDLYDPEPLEVLEWTRGKSRARRSLIESLTLDRVLSALADADHLMCASEKQRDLWLGAMLAERMIGHEDHEQDPSLRSRLERVPFGLPEEPPVAVGAGARARFLQIAAGDELILWNGGIWAWLDAPTAIQAVATLRERRPQVRLVFMGASTLPAARRAEAEARELAGELGLVGSHVFFNDTWVPYERRGDWLLEADCVLSAQADHLETRFAFRTRLLDALWAGRPIVCTSGDDLAAQVEREHLGAVAGPGDAVALAAALEEVLAQGRESFAARIAQAAAAYAWPVVAAPLLAWVEQPPDDGPRRPARRGPAGQRLRNAGFRTALRALNALGIESLPSV